MSISSRPDNVDHKIRARSLHDSLQSTSAKNFGGRRERVWPALDALDM